MLRQWFGTIDLRSLTFVINRPPKIVHLSIDLRENLVHEPRPVRIGLHPTDPVSSDLEGKHRAKSVLPDPQGFVAHIDPSLVQQVFYIPQRKRKPKIQHNRQTNDLGGALKGLKWVVFYHR
jgi:hypothetical protein